MGMKSFEMQIQKFKCCFRKTYLDKSFSFIMNDFLFIKKNNKQILRNTLLLCLQPYKLLS